MDEQGITVSGIVFSHGANSEYEFYFHTDHRGLLWQAWRYLRGQGHTRWYASVHQPGPGGVDVVLNSLIHHRECNAEIEAQVNVGDIETSVLLCGLAGLIRSGELPQYKSYHTR